MGASILLQLQLVVNVHSKSILLNHLVLDSNASTNILSENEEGGTGGGRSPLSSSETKLVIKSLHSLLLGSFLNLTRSTHNPYVAVMH
eukprot:SAG31_NODE_1773_length_7304_cov_2.180380_6_plen_88_part_00